MQYNKHKVKNQGNIFINIECSVFYNTKYSLPVNNFKNLIIIYFKQNVNL